MPCRTCQAPQGLQTCLFCGDPFCALHRADVDGATACTGCREAEVARKRRAAEAAKAAQPARAASDRLGAVGSPVLDGEGATAPLPPLPEPGGGGLVATLCAAAAAGVAAVYLRWMSERTLDELAKDVQVDPTATAAMRRALAEAQAGPWLWAATIGGTAFVFVTVWLLVKSKRSR